MSYKSIDIVLEFLYLLFYVFNKNINLYLNEKLSWVKTFYFTYTQINIPNIKCFHRYYQTIKFNVHRRQNYNEEAMSKQS